MSKLKLDRRVQKSQDAIKNAFTQLMSEKSGSNYDSGHFPSGKRRS